MRLLDFLTSTKRPAAGAAVCSAEELRQRILGLNRPDLPYQIRAGSADEADFVAEWKYEGEWRAMFEKDDVSEVYRIFLKLDPAAHVVRALDRAYTVERSLNGISFALNVSSERGQINEKRTTGTIKFNGFHKPTVETTSHLDTSEMKQPLQETVLNCGWIYKGVSLGKFS